MKKFFIIVAFLSVASYLYSQDAKPILSFEKTTHDFGDIKEDGGSAVYTFNFTNTGKQPLVIHNVSASCGCTTPEFTRTPVQPGSKGFVKVTFDPRNRPGNINKTITVTSNAQSATDILRITGRVLAKEKTLEDNYPRQIGDIRLKASNISFTKIDPTEVKTEKLEIINVSEKPVTITFDRIPAHLSLKMNPETIPAGGTGEIIAVFDANKRQDWGFVNDQVFLIFDGVKNNENRISVNATIEEDYSKWTAEQLANAPVIEFSETVFDFGNINKGDKVTHTFKVFNLGKSNLILRKVSASCGCTATQPDKNIILPGDEANITVTFDSRGRSGRQNQTITILSNDPKKASQLLRITSNIVD